ncbi:MAG TPA: type II toxin-antitoxin system PemK/MazF family toxin [Treponemataceae bacterium]|nr:type II toxin-antitoxin system PemK/MazF family toxin [Treponemataceae bacterium]
MKRGDLYRVYKGSKYDPREFRVFVIVSRQVLIDSSFSTVTCAPVYSRWDEISTQVPVSIDAGLKHDSAIHCDELISIPKSMLTDYIGTLTGHQLFELNEALKIALDIED